PFTLHHKVFIVDETTVITGSFNISSNATRSNDENLVIIQSPDIARLYIQEFDRLMSQTRRPNRADMRCG
ncbi:MAG: phospholipase, partial [Phototrophicales bacterium]